MRRPTALVVFLLLAAPIFLLSGCTGGEQQASQGRGGGATAQAGPTALEFWHALSGEHEAVIADMCNAFEAANPGYSVEPIYQGNYQQLKLKLSNALAAGSPPAVSLMYEGWATEFLEEGHLAPLQDFIDAGDGSFQATIDDIYPAFVAGNSRDGRLVTLPFNKSTYIAFYNKEKFEAAGLDGFPTTLEGLGAAAEKLTERDSRGEISVFGIGIRTVLEPFTVMMMTFGGNYLREAGGQEVVIDTPEARRALGFLSGLMNDKKVAFVDGGYMSEPFGSQRIAFYWGSSAGIPWVVRAAGGRFTVATASLPLADHPDAGYLSQGTNIGVFAAASERQKAGAWAFLRFIMSPEQTAGFAAKTGYLPVRRAALEVPILAEYIAANPAYQTCMNQLERLTFEPVASYWEQVRNEVIIEIESAYRGRTGVEAALKQAEARAMRVIDRARDN